MGGAPSLQPGTFMTLSYPMRMPRRVRPARPRVPRLDPWKPFLAGVMLGLAFLSSSAIGAGTIADPCALFFEWSYAAINGLGLSNTLHVGDNTWFAGVAFDL